MSARSFTIPKTVDWKWVQTGFSLYVVFHLLPSYLLAYSLIVANPFTLALWAFVGLAPIGFYIGFRSSGVTILEPGISALIYTFVLFLGVQRIQAEAVSFKTVAQSLAWMGAAFIVAVASAWVGELIQSRMEKRKEGRRV